MIKAIIFDFGQTLVDSADGFRMAEKEAQARIFSDLSLTVEEDFLSHYRQFRKTLHEQSNFSRKALWQEVYFYYCREPDLSLLETWENDYWEMVKSHTVLFPEAEETLKTLTGKYRLALITNAQGQQGYGTHRMNLFPGLEPYFEVVIIAGEGGVHPKPHPEPFRLCLEKLHVSPDESVYVGDDWRIDICGAGDAGLHPLWLQHHRVHRNWPQVKTSVPVISRLEELHDLETLLNKQVKNSKWKQKNPSSKK